MVTLVNRAKMATATTGTGTITLGAAEPGQQTFASAGILNGDTVRYTIEDGAAWEIGTGTYSSTGPTLTRSVIESSTGAAINLSGAARVFLTVAAGDLQKAADMNQGVSTTNSPTFAGLTVNGNITASTITGGTITGITDLAIADGGTGASTAANARTNLGLGTIATQASGAVAITGGTITGITDLAIADGGTGASTAAGALTNFGLTATATELNYTDGVTSNIQTQLNTKAPIASPVFTGTASAPYFNATTGGFTAVAADTAALPSFTWSGDTDTGIFRVGANSFGFSTAATERLRIGSAGQIGIGGANYGTSGQVLTSQGSGAAPVWGTPTGADKVWQSVTRNVSTNYQNTNAYPMDVLVTFLNTSGDATVYVDIGSSTTAYVERVLSTVRNSWGNSVFFVVPPGHYYRWRRQSTSIIASVWSERSA